MRLSAGNGLGDNPRIDAFVGAAHGKHSRATPNVISMTNRAADSTPLRSSVDPDALRPALLLAGAQVVVALIAAVLLTSGALA